MLKIFVINGRARVGKNTFCEQVGKILQEKDIPFMHESSVNPVREYLKTTGWEGKLWDGVTKNEYWRKAMFDCKKMFVDMDKHCFDDYAIGKLYEYFGEDGNGVLFFDIRESEYICQLKEYIEVNYPEIDFKAILIKKDIDEEFDNYAYADKNVEEYPEYDYVIENNGTIDDLRGEAIKFINDLKFDEEVKNERDAEIICK